MNLAVEHPGMGSQDASEFLCRLERKAGLAQGHAESMPNVVKSGAAIQRSTVFLDGIAPFASLCQRITQGRLLVCELSAGRRVEAARGRLCELACPFCVALGLIEIAASLIQTGQGEQSLDIGWVDANGASQIVERRVEFVASLVQDAGHVVDVGIFESVRGQAGEACEGGIIIASLEGAPPA